MAHKSKAVKQETAGRTKKEIHDQGKARFEMLVDNGMDERSRQLDDAKFADEDQWTDEIRNARENNANGARPVLTIDKINQYISQIVNETRKNQPAIKPRPVDDNADVKTAEVFGDIIRRIEYDSNADIAYSNAAEQAVKVGEGYWRIITDYVDEKSFNQEAIIKMVPDMFKVYLGEHDMPDGSDAQYGFIYKDVPDEVFEREYPDAKKGGTDEFNVGLSDDQMKYWRAGETVRVVEYFYKDYNKYEMVALENGETMPLKQYQDLVESPNHIMPPAVDMRTTTSHVVKWVKMTGAEILTQKEWLGKYIPIVKVVGKQSNVAGKKHFKGLVRLAKDSLRAYNYWFSALTEKIALAPKAPFIGAVGQFDTHRDRWQKANIENYAYLEYDPVEAGGQYLPPPQRQQPSAMEAAITQQLSVIEHNIETALGMFRASVGEASPQQSGKALQTLKVQTDQGTFNFPDNVALSVRYCGRQLIDLIPKLYDTQRIVRIIGEDGTETSAAIDPKQPQARITDGINSIYNLGVGKYDVVATVGASYATKRMEQSEILMQLAQNQPDLLAKIGDLLFKGMDFPMAQEIARRFEAELPPGLKPQQDGELPPEVQQIIQQVQQQAQELEGRAQALNEAENEINKAGLKVGKQAIEVMAKEENLKTELARIQLVKQEIMILQQSVPEGGNGEDNAHKLQLAEMQRDTEMIMALFKAEEEEKLCRLKTGKPTKEMTAKITERGESKNKAIEHLMTMVGNLQDTVAETCAKKETDDSVIEGKIEKLDAKIEEGKVDTKKRGKKKESTDSDVSKRLDETQSAIKDILSYLTMPKTVTKSGSGDNVKYTVRVK